MVVSNPTWRVRAGFGYAAGPRGYEAKNSAAMRLARVLMNNMAHSSRIAAAQKGSGLFEMCARDGIKAVYEK